LWRCLIYVDLNMVRAEAVPHPREWAFGGYHEIIGSKARNKTLDRPALVGLLELRDVADLERQHRAMIDMAVSRQNLERDRRWTECLAVGSNDFAAEFHAQLKTKGNRRRVIEQEGRYVVREG
jgi:putative transposase